MLREMLRNTNWSHAEFVDSATAAMAEIKANPPDLVFTDWQMPGQSGLELIRAIRDYQPEIVLASALADRHPDHGRAGKLISDACFLSGLRKIITTDKEGRPQDQWRPKYVFHFIQDRFYQPSFVYDTSAVFERKLEAIRCYSSQFHSTTYNKDESQTYISGPEFLGSIVGRDQMLGKMIGVSYAEAFISEKMIGISNMDAFVQIDT